jgi:tetratricopeptide (TPR) repeat protein
MQNHSDDTPAQPSPSQDAEELSAEDLQERFTNYIKEVAEETKAGSHDAAMLAAMQALMVAAQASERDNSPSAQLHQRKVELEEACDWPALLALQAEIVRYAETDGPKEMPDPPPHYAPGIAAKAWQGLAELQLLLGRTPDACESAQKAVRYARQADLSPMVVTALRTEAYCLIKLGNWSAARERAEESVNANEPTLPFVNTQIARGRILLARCLTELGEGPSARRELEQASQLIEQPGFHRELLRAEWRTVEAELLVREGDKKAAVEALKDAIQLRRTGEGTLFCEHAFAAARMATTLERLADLLAEGGDETAANNARREAAERLGQFRLPANP